MVLESNRANLTNIRESVSLYDIPKDKEKKDACAC